MDQKKSKKEVEFEQKLAEEKEEMLEKEKQLKINRLVQEVHRPSRCDPPILCVTPNTRIELPPPYIGSDLDTG